MNNSISRMILGMESAKNYLDPDFISIINTVQSIMRYDNDTMYNSPSCPIIPLDELQTNFEKKIRFKGICHDYVRFCAVVAKSYGIKAHGIFTVAGNEEWLGHSTVLLENTKKKSSAIIETLSKSIPVTVFYDCSVNDAAQLELWQVLAYRMYNDSSSWIDGDRGISGNSKATKSILKYMKELVKKKQYEQLFSIVYDPLDPEIDKYGTWNDWAKYIGKHSPRIELSDQPPKLKVPSKHFELKTNFAY